MDSTHDGTMTDGKRTASIHVRVSEESDALLELMRSAAPGRAKADIAAEVLEEALHGKGHALRVAAARYVRLGFAGKDRE